MGAEGSFSWSQGRRGAPVGRALGSFPPPGRKCFQETWAHPRKTTLPGRNEGRLCLLLKNLLSCLSFSNVSQDTDRSKQRFHYLLCKSPHWATFALHPESSVLRIVGKSYPFLAKVTSAEHQEQCCLVLIRSQDLPLATTHSSDCFQRMKTH